MKSYWDSSALVAACQDEGVRDRLDAEGGFTRLHGFAEVFSTLTGGRLGFRVNATDAVQLISELREGLHEVELSSEDLLAALGDAESKGVRGGRVHDFLHAVAAVKAGCERIWTLNGSDFGGLYKKLKVEEP